MSNKCAVDAQTDYLENDEVSVAENAKSVCLCDRNTEIDRHGIYGSIMWTNIDMTTANTLSK